jgi:hypothetical protein
MNDSRLETLLEKFQDDQLSTDESRELIEWINEDESRATEFADELRMSNALAALHVLDADGIAPAVRDSLSRAGETTDISRSVRRQIESAHPHLSAPVERSNVSLGQWPRWSVVSATAMLLLIGWFAFPTNDTAPDSTSVIAYVAHEVDAVWPSDSDSLNGEIKAGRLELLSGIVRLDFYNGASVTLQGPAVYEITGPMETRLHHGVLTARIPESAIGFTVETSAMDVVDLGTAFGVSVDRDGVTDVSVFEGSVEVRLTGSPSSLIVEGEAVRGGEGKQIASVPFDVSTYERVWPVALGVAKTTGSMRFVRPGPPWDLTTHRDDNDIIVFPEVESIHLKQPIGVDSVQPGELLREQENEGHTIAAGKTVRSYLLQFNPANRDPDVKEVLTGAITFSHPIAGIIWNADRLAQTDQPFGSDASHYEFPGRGIETPLRIKRPGKGRDRIFLSKDRFTLNLKLHCSVHIDQIRVLVETE